MIPYDDLVAALSAWRARQGLPVSTMGGTSAAPQPAAPAPGSGPRTAPPTRARTAPPVAPPRSKQPSVPPPLAQPDAEEVDAAMLDDAHYEPEGSDFALSFGGQADAGDGATAVGSEPPQRDTVPSGKRGRNDDEW